MTHTRSLIAGTVLSLVAAGTAAGATPHPRLWIRAADLPQLRARAASPSSFFPELAALAADAKAEMDQGHVPGDDPGTTTWVAYPTEMYAQLFAFMSLVDPSQAARDDYGERARSLLMHAVNAAAEGPGAGPFCSVDFSVDDRSRWWGESWALTVDWIYDRLSVADKQLIRQVFLRWAEENDNAEITTCNHPEPHGVLNDPALIADRDRVRWSSNNYYTAHMRNIGLMALAFDESDDPGGTLRGYLARATGAWLYVVDEMLKTECAGGIGAEGFEYSPQTMGYAAQLLLALHTAGEDDPSQWGPQVRMHNTAFWDQIVRIYPHMLSPVPVQHTWLGDVYQPAWVGDGQTYWAPDMIEVFGPIGLHDRITGNSDRLAAIRWIQAVLPPGGQAELASRVRDAANYNDAILYFLIYDDRTAPLADPRPSFPLSAYAAGMGHIYARTGWNAQARWLRFVLGWNAVDHQHADGNHFGFYRKGEWLTKDWTSYGLEYATSDYHNTLTIKNDTPLHDSDYRHTLAERGSQWLYTTKTDGEIVAHSLGSSHTFVLGDATGLYNSDYEQMNDVQHASRSLLWLKPDHLVLYDRAETGKADRFKRFWLQLPGAPEIAGKRTTARSAAGQQLIVTTVLPSDAQLTGSKNDGDGAEMEVMTHRLRVEDPSRPKSARFLHVLQGADPTTGADPVELVRSADGKLDGVRVGSRVALFPVTVGSPLSSVSYQVSAAVTQHFITGLTPNGSYAVAIAPPSGGVIDVSVSPGPGAAADSGGVLVWPAVAPPPPLDGGFGPPPDGGFGPPPDGGGLPPTADGASGDAGVADGDADGGATGSSASGGGVPGGGAPDAGGGGHAAAPLELSGGCAAAGVGRTADASAVLLALVLLLGRRRRR